MPIEEKFLRAAAILTLGAGWLAGAQTLEEPLASFVAQGIADAGSLDAATIGDWSTRHPGESVDTFAQRDRNYDSGDARQQQERELEGRWCLRSRAAIDLGGGVRVRRVALFYQPLVEQIYDRPLPPLPAETGEVLRRNGCRLRRILNEFDGGGDARQLAEELAQQIPGQRRDEPGDLMVDTGKDYWRPVYSFSGGANHFSIYSLAVHPPKAAAHYRAWYGKSTNQRDRALVWQEIWGIEAGLGPWLMAPGELRR